MAGAERVDTRKGHRSQKPPPEKQGVTKQMNGLSLGSTPTGKGLYAPAQAASYQPATAPRPQTASTLNVKCGPTQADLAAADKLLRALEKTGKLPPFNPKKFGKWTHDTPQQSFVQYPSIPTPGRTRALARYRCDCGTSYGEDRRAKAELDRHLGKHRSHRRAK
ncbi:hypothetical protein C8A00DRAFT_37183 [Chaetomidium leptoderma]|uniref:Uncharacterized protein n=1 Tax=Chaetomidium leptoderma TaxID=669021 RepID=A0AAN6ZU14_9PEZI|nr:hypothetical protein C8A00DRAFT_37183 [Chaetomidium leptoderma]